MDFGYSPKSEQWRLRLLDFFDEHIYPHERTHAEQLAAAADRWQPVPIIEELKAKARAAGLWNLFLPARDRGAGLTNLEYAPLAEMMGRVLVVVRGVQLLGARHRQHGDARALRHGGAEGAWLEPLLDGEIRSCFAMTEPDVASSDATNIQTRIVRDGDDYVINGRKWWSSGAVDPRCKIFIVMGKTDPDAPDRHRQQSMVLVPRDTPGPDGRRACCRCSATTTRRTATPRSSFEDVRVPVANMLLGEGRGFEIAQGRLGPGRIHHCMRAIGMAERALELMCRRVARARSRSASRWPTRASCASGIAESPHRDRPVPAADAARRVA